MYLSVLTLPLISCIIVGFLGRFIGTKGSTFIAVFLSGTLFLFSSFLFYEVGICGDTVVIDCFNWFSIGSLYVNWGFLFDTVTAVMLIVITSISFLVHLYSSSYMDGDPHLTRFMCYLSLFTFFMICMVISSNYAQLFLGWEGVGLSSYLLINFWFTRVQANKAAIKAIIVNRFGDFGVMFSLVSILYVFNTLNFNSIFLVLEFVAEYYITIYIWQIHALTLISFFLFLGCVGKSAQLGLHTWLPDAMEGPTPVSALIHAATMVTAGVFLLIRSSHILEYSSTLLIIITIVGALTAFFAGTIGIFQNDLKRVIAYSTCSQLGYMVFSCGLSNYSVAMFHLMNHAFFKALLFLSAGAVIHAVADEQDMRRMGGLIKLLPLSFSAFLIGSLALMGFPYTTGFYSKDVILELGYSNYYFEGLFAYWLGLFGAGCTAFYSMRLLYLTFIGETNSYKRVIEGVHDAPIRMALPLIILSMGSIFVGYVFKDLFIGLGTDFWGNNIGYVNNLGDVLLLEAEFLPAYIKLLPVLFSFFVSLVCFYLYSEYHHIFYLGTDSQFAKAGRFIYSFFNKKWFFDAVYNFYIVRVILTFGYNTTFKLLDRGIIELIGPTGLVRTFDNLSMRVRNLQTGYIFNYIFFMIVSVIVYLYFLNFDFYIFNSIAFVIYAMTILQYFYAFDTRKFK